MSIGQHSGMVGELIDEVELDKGKLGVNYMDLFSEIWASPLGCAVALYVLSTTSPGCLSTCNRDIGCNYCVPFCHCHHAAELEFSLGPAVVIRD